MRYFITIFLLSLVYTIEMIGSVSVIVSAPNSLSPEPRQLCCRIKMFLLGTLDICQPAVVPSLQLAINGPAEH